MMDARTPREQIEELEETVRQQKELLAPTVNLKIIGLAPQESRFVMCLYSSSTRVRTDAQLLAAVNGGVERDTDRSPKYLHVIRSHINKKLGDKIQIHRVRDVGWEIAEPSVEWLKTVVNDIATNSHNVYSLKNIVAQHVGEKRSLAHWNYRYPGAMPYKLPPSLVIVVELMLRGPTTLPEIMATTGWDSHQARTNVHHLWTRCIPPAFVLKHGSTRNRTYQIDPRYRAELKAGFATWWEKFSTMYDIGVAA